MSGRPRSTSARNSSIEHTDFFFEPVQLHLQPPNLLVERVARSFPVPPFATVHEKLRKLFQRTLPPFRNLDRMHLELRTQLTQRLLAAHRLDRNPRFELRTILLSRRRHRPLLCQRLRRNLTLLPGLNSGDHYRERISAAQRTRWAATRKAEKKAARTRGRLVTYLNPRTKFKISGISLPTPPPFVLNSPSV